MMERFLIQLKSRQRRVGLENRYLVYFSQKVSITRLKPVYVVNAQCVVMKIANMMLM
jgi:hypothetical protein